MRNMPNKKMADSYGVIHVPGHIQKEAAARLLHLRNKELERRAKEAEEMKYRALQEEMKAELAVHPLELVPGYNDPDDREIEIEPATLRDLEEEAPLTKRSVENPFSEQPSGVRSKTPEQLLIEQQRRLR